MDFKSSPITLDQLHILSKIEQEGSVARAAKSIHRAHSALLYAITHLEQNLAVKLVDRSGYRLKLTPFGRNFLMKARELLQLEENLRTMSLAERSGWESELSIVYDGVLPSDELMQAAHAVRKLSPSTNISLYSEYLRDVEVYFNTQKATAMITVLPVKNSELTSFDLPKFNSWLVVHKDHPLAKSNRSSTDLESYPFLTVRGSDDRIELPTSRLRLISTLQVGDFYAKKLGIMKSYGFGWLPEQQIKSELRKKELVPIRWSSESKYPFHPKYFIRSHLSKGKAAAHFLKEYLKLSK